MNDYQMWESLNHCEQLSYLHYYGLKLLNLGSWSIEQTKEISDTLLRIFVAMITGGCDSWV